MVENKGYAAPKKDIEPVKPVFLPKTARFVEIGRTSADQQPVLSLFGPVSHANLKAYIASSVHATLLLRVAQRQ